MTRPFAALALAFAFALGACSATSGRLPTARITLAPAYVALGDAYTTDVTVDGTASSDSIDDPAALHPLAFAWSIDDAAARFAPDDHSARATVRVAGARPVAVHLTVMDYDGDSGSVTAMIGVTIP